MIDHKELAVAAGDPEGPAGLGAVVREFTPSDLDQVIRIENASFPVDAFREWEFRRLHSANPREFLVADVSGAIVGYVVGSTTGDCGEIESLAVDESARGHGIGAMLTRRLLDRFRERGLRICRLEVRAANAVAIDLYERLGFRVIGKRPGYYANGADAFVMAHALRGTDLLAPWASPAPIAVPPSKPALAPTTAPVPGLPKTAPIGAPAAAPRAVPIAAGRGVPPPH